MFFVHPQIQLKNLGKAALCFFKKANLERLQRQLSFYFPGKQFVFTDMGRTAFRVLIEKLNLQSSQMLVPAYICDIFLPIFQRYNIQPIFLDIDLKTFNIKIDEVQRKLTPATKAILVCHTYGLPADIQKIKQIIQSTASKFQRPLIIEDCAHSFGARNSDPTSASGGGRVAVGNSGDVAFFSLYKQFPTLRGGLLVCPNDWQIELKKTQFNFRDFISFLNCFPFFAYLFKCLAAGLAPKMLREEKFAEPAGINRVSLNLFSAFLDDFEKDLARRRRLALFFQKELRDLGFEVQSHPPLNPPLPKGGGDMGGEGDVQSHSFCYLSVLVPKCLENKRDEIVQKLRKYKVFATRIWHTPIILNKEAQREYNIDLSDFPNTIEAARRIINFPLQNYFNKHDIEMATKQIKRVILVTSQAFEVIYASVV